MTPAELSRTVLRSVRGAVEEQELSVPVPARIVVRPSPRPGWGDYASNVALQLAKQAGRPAREVAEILRKRLAGSPGIARVEIAGPGFLNFTLGDEAQIALVREVLAQGSGYGDRSARTKLSARTAEAGSVDDSAAGSRAREVVVAEALARIEAAAGAPARSCAPPVPDPPDLVALLARLGSDEARWVLLRPAAHDPVRVPERPVQRESNPRFRVQYAHARARALVRNAGELGFSGEPGDVGLPVAEGVSGVADEAARRFGSGEPAGTQAAPAGRTLQGLLTLLATYPSAIDAAARLRAPDRVVRHLEATADAFFRWHDDFPPLPVGEQKPLAVHRARLALAEAAGTVLANGLHLLGISAPEYL
ncbi:ArgS-related anticodon-binding protein NrtL [Streptomyces sp. C184]|uniref:ArgS-related anticodon-binding protein NrtL n=1 Tax=Streptomyces sp. C184 TaxID=3237121 RepID=UPI0034C61E20